MLVFAKQMRKGTPFIRQPLLRRPTALNGDSDKHPPASPVAGCLSLLFSRPPRQRNLGRIATALLKVLLYRPLYDFKCGEWKPHP